MSGNHALVFGNSTTKIRIRHLTNFQVRVALLDGQ